MKLSRVVLVLLRRTRKLMETRGGEISGKENTCWKREKEKVTIELRFYRKGERGKVRIYLERKGGKGRRVKAKRYREHGVTEKTGCERKGE